MLPENESLIYMCSSMSSLGKKRYVAAVSSELACFWRDENCCVGLLRTFQLCLKMMGFLSFLPGASLRCPYAINKSGSQVFIKLPARLSQSS